MTDFMCGKSCAATTAWRRRTAFRALSVLILSTTALTAWALEPPRPGEKETYRADGSLAARTAFARSLGNHEVAPWLVLDAQERLAEQKSGAPSRTLAPPPAWEGMPRTGNVKVLTLLISFADHPSSNSNSTIDSKLFGDGDPSRYPYESLRNYYRRSSYDQLEIQGNVLGWYATAYPRSTVSEDRSGRENLIKEALSHYDNQGHDFAQYDNDGDGIIDYLVVIWTGPDTGWGNFWWGYMTHFTDAGYTLDGKQLRTYSWQWEASPYPGSFSTKVVIHETGHALGLPDFYDYDEAVGPSGGLGGLDMMDANYGDHNCFSKFLLDWITPQFLTTETTRAYSFRPSSVARDTLVVMPGAQAGNQFDEYFMVQARDRTLNDTTYPNDGLLVWHVDARLNPSGTDYLYDNSYSGHKLLRLMEADGLERIERGYIADAGDYYTAGRSFGPPPALPSSNTYAGSNTGVVVDGISGDGDPMMFEASCGTLAPAVKLENGTPLEGRFVDAGAWNYYYIDILPGATSLQIWTSDAPNDVDLFTRFGSEPSLNEFDCRPWTASGNETCVHDDPAAGRWWAAVYGYAAGGYTITAAHDAPGGQSLENGVPVPGCMDAPTARESWQYYHVDIAPGSSDLVIGLDDMTEDLDLHVRYGEWPQLGAYDCRPFLDGTSPEQCSFPNPVAGRYWIGVNNWATGTLCYTLLAQWTPAATPEIDVVPISMTQSLVPDGTATQFLTIHNQGGASLEFDITEGPIVASVRSAPRGTPSRFLSTTTLADAWPGHGSRVAALGLAEDVSWLREEPTSGTLAPAGSQQVLVTFDATGLAPGAYDASLVVSSNDPATPTVVLPVHLSVTGTTHLLTVDFAGAGTGVVTSDPVGIDCDSGCAADYAEDTFVTLTATAPAGSRFESWSGCDSSSETTCSLTMTAPRTVTATFGLPGGGQELIVDYEADQGTWILYDGYFWSQLHATSPDSIVPANTDGNATDELLVDFGGSTGVWMWDPVATPRWRKFYDSSPNAIVPADTDGNANEELAFDFGPGGGVWFWSGDTTPRWKKFYDASPLAITPADTDGNSKEELVVNISVDAGLWIWSYLATPKWRKFYDQSPVGVTPADLDGDGQDELVVNISAVDGTWIWSSTATPKWSKLYDASPEELIRADIDGDGQDDLVANLGAGNGLWVWSDAATPKWRKIRGQIPESLIAADLDSDGKDELVADFGPGTGLRIYRGVGGAVWQWTTQAPPDGLGLDENASPGALGVAELGSAWGLAVSSP